MYITLIQTLRAFFGVDARLSVVRIAMLAAVFALEIAPPEPPDRRSAEAGGAG